MSYDLQVFRSSSATLEQLIIELEKHPVMNEALKIAFEVHGERKEELGTLEIEHIYTVLLNTQRAFAKRSEPGGRLSETDVLVCFGAALLHDVIENTDGKIDGDIIARRLRSVSMGDHHLLIGAIVDTVMLLTRRQNDDSYLDYLLRLKEHRYAPVVKVADLRHNSSRAQPGSRRDKYFMALHILGA